MKDEDYAYETQRQKRIDQGEVKMIERTPEEQAAHDKDMKDKAKKLLTVPNIEIHAQAASSLASMVRAVVDGTLKPEGIPPTEDELLVVTYIILAQEALSRKLKGVLGGLQ
jgi:hypothetical protein